MAGRTVHDLISGGSRIGRMCALFGLTPRAIRFYEERGLIRPGRDAQNRRLFDGLTRRRLELIAELRRAGLPLQEIHSLLEVGGTDAALVRRNAMERLRRRLVTLERARDDLLKVMHAFEAAA
jgi:DNA-binding transcriptional MerR regulator